MIERMSFSRWNGELFETTFLLVISNHSSVSVFTLQPQWCSTVGAFMFRTCRTPMPRNWGCLINEFDTQMDATLRKRRVLLLSRTEERIERVDPSSTPHTFMILVHTGCKCWFCTVCRGRTHERSDEPAMTERESFVGFYVVLKRH